MVTETVAALSSGAKFFRGDLHIHSFGASHDVTDATATPGAIVDAAKATNDQATIVTRGSIDHPETCEAACAILEGSREAFDRRAAVYGIARKA